MYELWVHSIMIRSKQKRFLCTNILFEVTPPLLKLINYYFNYKNFTRTQSFNKITKFFKYLFFSSYSNKIDKNFKFFFSLNYYQFYYTWTMSGYVILSLCSTSKECKIFKFFCKMSKHFFDPSPTFILKKYQNSLRTQVQLAHSRLCFFFIYLSKTQLFIMSHVCHAITMQSVCLSCMSR